jgi:hypothetical protein
MMLLSGGEMLPPGEAMVFSHCWQREKVLKRGYRLKEQPMDGIGGIKGERKETAGQAGLYSCMAVRQQQPQRVKLVGVV